MEIILKLCDIMATHLDKAGVRMESRVLQYVGVICVQCCNNSTLYLWWPHLTTYHVHVQLSTIKELYF